MRSRGVLFALLALTCVVGVGAAVWSATRAGDATGSEVAAGDELAQARDREQAVAVFRQPARDGQVAFATLDDTARSTPTDLRCDRIDVAGGAGICVGRGTGFAAGYRAKLLDDALQVRHEVDVAGVPSRARVSPDGKYASVTMFVTGHSYADAGAFSTETTLIDLGAGEKLADLEDFRVSRDGRPVTAIDVNYWGVTFAHDSDRFYATLATGGKTYLIEGSVRARTARVLHENVECPSLSPDGTRVAYKRRTGSDAVPWRLAVLDLATMRETVLSETRSVDDQAEWLDDDTVLYGLDGAVMAVAADGSGSPRRFLADADSPAVVRW